MRYVLTIVEQLDRAATELATDHPINNRLALILIDNATELILHRQCTYRLAWDRRVSSLSEALKSAAKARSLEGKVELSGDLGALIMTPKQRVRAKGKHLDGRLKVLEEMGDLTSAERRFIAIAHGYRDELYHVGLTHDDIIRAIAGHYFLLCCSLFVRMDNLGLWGLTISSSDTYTDVAKRYLPMHDGHIDPFNIDNETLAGKLVGALPDEIPTLANALANKARSSIAEVVENFRFLVRDNPFDFDEKEMLEVAQWQKDLTEALEHADVEGLWADPNYQESYIAVATELEATWKQRHSSIPRERWMQRAGAIERTVDPLTAMDSYQSLRTDMSYLEEAIQSAAEDLDQWIQHEIDKARGK